MTKPAWGEMKAKLQAIPQDGFIIVVSRRVAHNLVSYAGKIGIDLWMRNLSGRAPYEQREYLMIRCHRKDLERILSTSASNLMGCRSPMKQDLSRARSESGRRGGMAGKGDKKRRGDATFYRELAKKRNASRNTLGRFVK